MTNSPRMALIGDANQQRVGLLKEILNEEFGVEVDWVDTYDQVKDKIQSSDWLCVLVAHDLPYSYSNQLSILPGHIEYLFHSRPDVRVGLIIDANNLAAPRRSLPDLFQLHVFSSQTEIDQRNEIIEIIKCFIGIPGELPKVLIRASLEVELQKEPSLLEQIRALSIGGDEAEGKMHISQLISLLFDCDKVKVGQLGQGNSGASIFHIIPSKNEHKIGEFVVKICSNDDLWKIRLETEKYIKAKKYLEIGKYSFHGAELQLPHSLTKANGGGIENDEGLKYVVSNGRWNAICYDYLGGEKLGELLDLESALVLPKDILDKKTKNTKFAFDPQNETKVKQARICVLTTMLDWLCDNLYVEQGGKGKRVKRENRRLWNFDDSPIHQYDPVPPYMLAGKTKSKILSFLNSHDAQLGERFFTPNWEARHKNVLRFLLGDHKPWILSHDLPVVLSPAHGDLNANNILLWLAQREHPFLIDFPFYQENGHSLQDLARLEVEIKFGIMDRQGDSPREKLLAFDHTASQMFLWQKLEERLQTEFWADKIRDWGKGGYKNNVEFIHDLIRIVRQRAFLVYNQYLNETTGHSFIEEYFPALLYHTLRAIGYDSLPIFKRLLAVYSAGLILEKLSKYHL